MTGPPPSSVHHAFLLYSSHRQEHTRCGSGVTSYPPMKFHPLPTTHLPRTTTFAFDACGLSKDSYFLRSHRDDSWESIPWTVAFLGGTLGGALVFCAPRHYYRGDGTSRINFSTCNRQASRHTLKVRRIYSLLRAYPLPAESAPRTRTPNKSNISEAGVVHAPMHSRSQTVNWHRRWVDDFVHRLNASMTKQNKRSMISTTSLETS